MKSNVSTMAEKAALPPGSLVHVGESHSEKARVSVLIYGREECGVNEGLDAIPKPSELSQNQFLWCRMRGVSDLGAVSKIGEHFKLHALVMEDVVNTQHNPKLEDYEDYLFLVCKLALIEPGQSGITYRQVSLLLGENWVVSFEQTEDSVDLSALVKRLGSAKSRVRKLGPAYLFYALADLITDSYFKVLESLETRLEEIEEEVDQGGDESVMRDIYQQKRSVMRLRRMAWAQREAAGRLLREDSPLITEPVFPFLRDLYDHATHVLEVTESFKDNLSALMDLSLSQAGHRMNQIMKVLTVIATIFIPLTFVAGLYGMNFKHMPELELAWAYPAVLILMGVIVLAMLLYFKEKKWL